MGYMYCTLLAFDQNGEYHLSLDVHLPRLQSLLVNDMLFRRENQPQRDVLILVVLLRPTSFCGEETFLGGLGLLFLPSGLDVAHKSSDRTRNLQSGACQFCREKWGSRSHLVQIKLVGRSSIDFCRQCCLYRSHDYFTAF